MSLKYSSYKKSNKIRARGGVSGFIAALEIHTFKSPTCGGYALLHPNIWRFYFERECANYIKLPRSNNVKYPHRLQLKNNYPHRLPLAVAKTRKNL